MDAACVVDVDITNQKAEMQGSSTAMFVTGKRSRRKKTGEDIKINE